jgi:5-methylcytosine-specific restriction protein A
MSGYPYNTQRWKRVRLLHLKGSPFCLDCYAAGRLVLASVVDHVVPISAGGPAFPGPDGLRSLCPSCHSQKTARGSEAGAVRTTRARQPRKGCDANGNPLDPSHPWRAEKSLGADALDTASGKETQLVRQTDYLGGDHG